MEIRHEWEHGPEIIYSHFDADECLKEFERLAPVLQDTRETGGAVDEDGNPMKSNDGIWLDKIYSPLGAKCSPCTVTLNDFISVAKSMSFTTHSFFQYLYTMQGFDALFSAYGNGGHYKPHRDRAKITVLMWVGQKEFDGGDLYLPDFDYTIPYEPSKLIMLPSCYRHEVTPISTDQEGFVRYCASAFIN